MKKLRKIGKTILIWVLIGVLYALIGTSWVLAVGIFVLISTIAGLFAGSIAVVIMEKIGLFASSVGPLEVNSPEVILGGIVGLWVMILCLVHIIKKMREPAYHGDPYFPYSPNQGM